MTRLQIVHVVWCWKKCCKCWICEEGQKYLPKFELNIFAPSGIKNVDEINVHRKTIKSTTPKAPNITVKKVIDLYNQHSIARQLPYKNLTQKVKEYLRVYHCVLVHVMEATLTKAYGAFNGENSNVKLTQCGFEKLRSKNIRLRSYAQRLQCCCTYHKNIHYIRQACNTLFI